MRKFFAVYLVFATIVMGGLSAIAQTTDLKAVSKMTREKQVAKQEKVDYIVATLASKPVQEAMQKAGLKLNSKDAEMLAKFAPSDKLDLLYSQCTFVNKSMAMGQGWNPMNMIWIIIGVTAVVVLIILLLVLLAAEEDYYWYDDYYWY
jgi:hypothetical protein